MGKDFYKETMQKYSNEPLREMVLMTLRRAILLGKLKPGERLMEIHLSELLGVSRTPVREAIRQLETEGLVVMVPRHGAYVDSITEKSLMDVLEVRRALEGLAASRASRRITPDVLLKLRAAYEKYEMLVESPEATLDEIVEADIAFHDVILNATENDKLISIMNNLADQMSRYRYEYIKESENQPTIMREHRLIYRALAEKDEDEAVRMIQLHVDSQADAIVRQLKNDSGEK